MTSSEPESSLDFIARHAATADELAESRSLQERIAELEERLASIEPLLEQREQAARVSSVFGGYIQDLRDEQKFMKVARWMFGGSTMLFAVMLVALLALAVFHPASPLLTAATYPAALFIVGCVSGVVVLLLALVRGVFRTAAERHGEGFVPPQIEAALQLYDRLKGGS